MINYSSLKILGLLCLIGVTATDLSANSDIFPATDAGKSAVNWDHGYFNIDGKPTFLTSGEMHYARIPRELWKDRIWRSKMMGFNCMQMYVFWNVSEPKENEWSFTDNANLDEWLSAIQAAGMYATVRVGPYSCAEWEHGGFPGWLTVKPGMTLRDMGPEFIKRADAHLAQVEKIVAKHQINHGGNVILVQLENEHRMGWGTDGNDYLHHLYDQARQNGLEVPLFFSGLHHGAEPSGNTPFKVGASPWYSTEFWTGWIGKYGDMQNDALAEKIAGTWKIIAFGGAGYDYYMVHGGTNFGYSGDSFEATYDYSAPIGESGHFNNFYYPAKRAAWFARSFNDLLTGSSNDPNLAKVDQPGLRVTSRTNPQLGSFILIDNFQKNGDRSKLPEIAPNADAYSAPALAQNGLVPTRIQVGDQQYPTKGSFNVSALEPKMLLLNIAWTPNATFKAVCGNVLLRQTLGDTDYWVIYGNPGDAGEVSLAYKDGTSKPISLSYPADDSFTEIPVDSKDGHKALLLVMNTSLTNRTWWANGKLFVGPSFVTESGASEFPPEGGHGFVYTAAGKSNISGAPFSPDPLPELGAWQWRDAAPERAADLDVSKWSHSDGPLPMGSYDDYQNRYGWYSTEFREPAACTVGYRLTGSAGDYKAFLNGSVADLVKLTAKAGDNRLTLFFKTNPRSKLFGYTGPVDSETWKGIWGIAPADSVDTVIPNVKWTMAPDPKAFPNPSEASRNDFPATGWIDFDGAQFPLHKQEPLLLRGTFTLNPDQVDSWLDSTLRGPDDSRVYLNGRVLSAVDPESKLVAGENTIAMTAISHKELTGSVQLKLTPRVSLAHSTWYFHGGLHDLDETAIVGRVKNWDEFLKSAPWTNDPPQNDSLPKFYHTTFTYQHPQGRYETIGLITNQTAQAKGHVWLNGHNLGEYPQKVPMYMPECWLNDGTNDLVIFDFNGIKPQGIQLSRYETFSINQTP